MAIEIDDASVSMRWTTVAAAKPAATVGKHFALLHLTKGANTAAGDTMPAGKVNRENAMTMEATVFVRATAGEFDFGDNEFGMVQVTQLHAYQFEYAGRVASEGSVTLDPGSALRAPTLDVEPEAGQTIDEHIFDFTHLTSDRVTTPETGFRIKVTFGDHPNNSIPLTFENTLTRATNFLARAHRNQHFVVYFVTRPNASGPLRILGRLGWAVLWDVEFNWKGLAAPKAKATVTRSTIFPGEFRKGPPPAGDAWADIAVNRSGRTTNAIDTEISDRIDRLHQRPECDQRDTRPAGFRETFFT